MKRILVVAALGLGASALAQVQLNVSIQGKPAGTATVSQKIVADGSKMVELRIELASLGKKANVRLQSTFDAKGMPIRKFLEAIVPGGEVQRQTVVTFNTAGANVVLLNGGDRSTKQVGLSAVAPRACLSEFWFLRDHPKPGAKSESYIFNMDSLEWELTTTTYVGLKTVTINGHKFAANELTSDSNSRKTHEWVDEKGLPILIEDGRMKMERVMGK